ncbi:MAG: type I restriction enzyme HsdR N-terminal domain-containing protein [Vicingaceae bacterium]
MRALNLPQYPFKIIQEGKKTKIFDAIRRGFFVLTPEEWVRQNLIQFLIEDRAYPKGLIAIEKGLKVNGLPKRFDALVYHQNGNPKLLVECKAPEIQIDQKAFDQIARYNYSLKLPYLLVSNGLQHYCAKVNWQTKEFEFLNDIPHYEEILD